VRATANSTRTATTQPSVKLPHSIRQSVTLPAEFAVEIKRVAEEKHLTVSRTLVLLAQQGLDAENAARHRLDQACDAFLAEQDPIRKKAAGKTLVQAIFGPDAIAEDPIR
jgi:predicted DNA-binding ribbon-helix-helix protein